LSIGVSYTGGGAGGPTLIAIPPSNSYTFVNSSGTILLF
jgi:hypothetical protein